MTRVVSLFLPSWPTDRARKAAAEAAPPAEAPLVLVGRQKNRQVVTALDAAARAAGLRPGMPAAKARILAPGLTVWDAEPEADVEALERLAEWALRRVSPVVAADPPDGIVIDSTGADHLHGGEEAMLTDLVERLAGAGIAARACVAESRGAAHALARYGARPILVAAAGASPALLAPLPVEALRLEPALCEALRLLGIRTIGDLAGQPRAPLALRFGPEPGRRLDQAFGRIAEPIEAVRPAELVAVRRSFGEPIGAAETIARHIGQLVNRLCAELERCGLGARRLDLVCHRVDDRLELVRVGLALPVRDERRLTRLLCDKIETIDPGFGIERMVLSASLSEPIEARQMVDRFGEEPAAADISGLVDTLANRLGERAVYRVAPVASDVPERSVRRIAALAVETGATWPAGWPRPARLLARPEPIETVALLPDHPPVAFTWRGVRRRVKRADGPERIFGEWWKRDAETAAVRDYFRVEDDAGERYWIYRAGDGEDPATGSHRWFLHGVFG